MSILRAIMDIVVNAITSVLRMRIAKRRNVYVQIRACLIVKIPIHVSI